MEGIDRAELERAARRIMEMNARAQSAVQRGGEPHSPSRTSPQENSKGRHEKPTEAPQKSANKNGLHPSAQLPFKPTHSGGTGRGNSIFDIINFKGLVGDSDRTLLAGIMLLLGADAADEKLMLALLYIML